MNSLSPRSVLRVWRAIGWFGVALLLYLSLTPRPPEIPIEQGDKLGHALAYAVLMFWWSALIETSSRRRWLAGGLLALGIAIEFAQGWTGWRMFDYYDMLADAAGIAVGWLVAWPRTPDLLALLGGRGVRRGA